MIILTQTDRLIIRTWVPEQDAEQAFQIYGDHEVTRFLITKVDSVESSRNLLQRWVTNFAQLNNGTGLWAIALKDSREIVGTIILIQLRDEKENLTQDYEIGWHLKTSAWGKGYAALGVAESKYEFTIYGCDQT
ncbi:GNAT family N-acetyltransferase [Fischerella thermalis]|jgi:ribosomal-protein-alanine N-acetyltransferase|uniref:GNAT family N-acetyltransferase n=1 Tax=Fischerella thermalis TaxID=372787 RepID=UPI000C80FE7F|nr:GNAT family N-acetyltransferase [Fischerella thermalis]PLZ07690.1 hypothetical protein CBP19_18610 [Fischerella thermalis WC1110]PLZ09815.1 hypothetical protein CBP17_13185 [Fischerella thermalis WC114]PLZ10850.1 hypothetical protein CBP18_09870 [Fischerella thermalis WC119]PLZ19344.1 hypothetical protein CBP30_13390 [Fischerella thermalis WC157]PLZ29820.1 hypothetical protein CBP10_14340 [Fischerella thermalis WC558]